MNVCRKVVNVEEHSILTRLIIAELVVISLFSATRKKVWLSGGGSVFGKNLKPFLLYRLILILSVIPDFF